MNAPLHLALPLSLLALGCVTEAPSLADGAQPGQEPGAPAQASGQAEARAPAPKGDAPELSGTLVPAEFEAVSLWPETYSGELLVLEVLEHGATVRDGDVIARLDTRGFDEALRDAELSLGSAEIGHAGTLERNELAEAGAREGLEQARARLERARRALAGYKESELAFAKRGDELRAQREHYYVDDQLDELAQLEAMYDADELVDATEEIVLKRSRRDLEATRAGNALTDDRRRYDDVLTEPLQLEAREEDVLVQAQALERLLRSMAVETRSRVDAAMRSAVELEKKKAKLEELRRDGALLTLLAPRGGVLLHGKARDYRPGGNAPRVERGSRLSTRTDIFLVADPERLAVAVDVPEKSFEALRAGAEVSLSPLSRPDLLLSGKLAVADFPSARSAGKDGGVFEGTIALEPGARGLVFGMNVKVELPLGNEGGTEPSP